MANNDLKLLVQTTIDTSPRAVASLNEQIKQLSGKLSGVQIKVNIVPTTDSSSQAKKEPDFLQTMFQSIQEQAKKKIGELEKFVDESVKKKINPPKDKETSESNDSAKKLNEQAENTEKLSQNMTKASVASSLLKAGLAGLASGGIGVVFSLASFGVEKLIGHFANASAAAKELDRKLKDTYTTQIDFIAKLNDLNTQYNSLSTMNGLSGSQLDQLNKVRQDLSSAMPQIISYYDAEGNAVYANAQQVSKLVDEYRALNTERAKAISEQLSKNIKDDTSQLPSLSKKKNNLQDELNNSKAKEEAITYIKNFKEQNILDNLDIDKNRQKMEELHQGVINIFKFNKSDFNETAFTAEYWHTGNLAKAIEIAKNEKGKIQSELINTENEIKKHQSNIINGFKTTNQALLGEYKISDKNVTLFFNNFATKFVESNQFTKKNQEELINKYRNYSDQIMQLQNSGKIDLSKLYDRSNVENMKKVFEESKIPTEALQALIVSMDNVAPPTNVLGTSLQKLTGIYKSSEDAIAPLNRLIAEQKNGQTLTAEATADLIAQYPELSSAIKTTSMGYQIEISALEGIKELKIKKAITDLESEKRMTVATLANSLSRVTAYGIELSNIKNVQDAKSKLAQINEKEKQNEKESNKPSIGKMFNVFDFGGGYAANAKKQANEGKKALKEYIDYVEESERQTDLLNKLLNDPNLGNPVKSNNSGNQSIQLRDALELRDTIHEQITAINERNEINKQSLAIQEKRIAYAEKEKDYNKAVEEGTALIKLQQDAIKDLGKSNQELSSNADALKNSDENSKLNASGKSNNDFFDSWFDINGQQSKAFVDYYNSFAERSIQIRDDTSLSIEQRNEMIEALDNERKQAENLFNQLSQLKEAYKSNVNEQTRLNDAMEVSKQKIASIIDEKYKFSKQWIQDQKEQGKLSLTDEWAAWNRIINNHQDKEGDSDEVRAANAAMRKEAQKEAKRVSWEITQDNVNQSVNQVKQYDDLLAASKSRTNLLDKNDADYSRKYSEELVNQKHILEEKLQAEKRHQEVIEQQMNTVGLTKEQWEGLNSQLKQSVTAQIGVAVEIQNTNQALVDQQNKIADEVIAIYKDMYEKEKQVALDAHDKQLKLLDDQLKKYNEFANAKLKALDEQSSEEDYADQLDKMTKQRDKTVNEINKHKLDTSYEGKARVAELTKQLGEQNEEIEKFQLDRRRTVQKQAIQNEMEEYAKRNEYEKEQEEKKKNDIEKIYNDKLNDERHFADIRQKILKGNIADIEKDFGEFKKFALDHSGEIGDSISNNIIDKINKITPELKTAKDTIGPELTAMSTNIQGTLIKSVDDLIAKLKSIDTITFDHVKQAMEGIAGGNNAAQEDYYQAKNETEKTTIARMKENANKWNETKDLNVKRDLEEKNYTAGYGMGAHLVASEGRWYKDDLPLFDSGGYTGDFSGGRLAVLHEKELVLNKFDTSNILKAVDITRDFITNMKNFDFAKLIAKPVQQLGTTIEHLQVTITGQFGDRNAGERVGLGLINTLKAKGVNL